MVGQSCLGSSFQGVTLTPPLSRKPGEGVNGSRTYKGLFGAEFAEKAERENRKKCLRENVFEECRLLGFFSAYSAVLCGEPVLIRIQIKWRGLWARSFILRKFRIVREKGPTRRAMIEGFDEPVYYGVHGGIKKFYKVEPEKEHAATLDHIVAATAG